MHPKSVPHYQTNSGDIFRYQEYQIGQSFVKKEIIYIKTDLVPNLSFLKKLNCLNRVVQACSTLTLPTKQHYSTSAHANREMLLKSIKTCCTTIVKELFCEESTVGVKDFN